MDIYLIIFVAVVLIGITVLYKALPHRNLGVKKPIISFLPKYKAQVKLPSSILNAEKPEKELEKILSKFGFTKKSQNGEIIKYTRGHILGDISIKLIKVNLLVSTPKNESTNISLEAGWVVAFDTGDFWKFLTELKEKIEKEV